MGKALTVKRSPQMVNGKKGQWTCVKMGTQKLLWEIHTGKLRDGAGKAGREY